MKGYESATWQHFEYYAPTIGTTGFCRAIKIAVDTLHQSCSRKVAADGGEGRQRTISAIRRDAKGAAKAGTAAEPCSSVEIAIGAHGQAIGSPATIATRE